MSLDTVIMSFGAFVAILPFLQFPQNWTSFFAFLAGIIIIGLGVAVRRRGVSHAAPVDQASLFVTETLDQDQEVEEE